MQKHLSNQKIHLKKKKHFGQKYKMISILSAFIISFAFTQNSPSEILTGLKQIIFSNDVLISDYFLLGNVGAAFLNSGILLAIFSNILYRMKIKLTGPHLAGLFIIAGFGFFGKNLLNVWFPFIGVYLFSKYNKEPFTHFTVASLFSTTLSPIVSEIMFHPSIPYYFSIPASIIVGISLGFITVPVASHLINAHQGLSIFNIGFSSGFIAMLVISLFKSHGFSVNYNFLWSKGNNFKFAILLYFIFISILIYGFILNKKSFKNYKKLLSFSGRLITDFSILVGKGVSIINIGVMGILLTTYILIIKGDLNGPTIGSIIAVSGFGAFGLHPKNVAPVIFGVILASSSSFFDINSPSTQLAAIFSTSLAPIAGEFGILWGIIVGVLHLSVVKYTGSLYEGLNLYNNGFASGIVATVIAPIIEAIRKERI